MEPLITDLYIIQDASNIKSLFRASVSCSSILLVKFAVQSAFGLYSKAAALYDRDNSGGSHIYHPGSTVEPRSQIDYLGHQSITRFLLGEGLGRGRYGEDERDVEGVW